MDEVSSGIFNEVPANARVQGFYGEIDDSLAGFFQENQLVLVVAQGIAGRAGADVVADGVLTLVPGDGSAAKAMFGRGSILARMVEAFRQGNRVNTLYVVSLADPAGNKAAQTVTISGPATAAGTLTFYVGEDRLQVAVGAADTAEDVAAALVAAVTAASDLPVTAAVTATPGEVTFTARNAGLLGNDIHLAVNRRGKVNGEILPAGVAVAIPNGGYLAGGTGSPVMAPAIAAMGDQEFDYVCQPYTDAASLDAWTAEMDGRWGPLRQVYGHVFTAKRGSLSELTTYGQARNDKHISTIRSYLYPAPPFIRAARLVAQASKALANHPARPLHTLPLVGEMAPDSGQEPWTWSDTNTLLFSGVSTDALAAGGVVQIGRIVTHYQKNAAGDPDTAWLDVTTPATLTRLMRELRYVANQRFIQRRCLLVKDGTDIGPGIPYATPSLVKAYLVAHHSKLERQGLVEDTKGFAKRLQVGIAPDDPTRLNIVYQPDIANPLVVFAAQVGFYLNFAGEAGT